MKLTERKMESKGWVEQDSVKLAKDGGYANGALEEI